jgi:hypothetical protein
MPTDVTVYRPISPLMRVLILLTPVVLAAVVLSDLGRGNATLPVTLKRFGPFLLVATIVGYPLFRQAHTVLCHNTAGLLEFATFFGTRSVRAIDIRSISPTFLLQPRQLVLRHAGGSVTISAQFAGLHDLIEWIRQQNPSVALKGL